MGAQRQKEKDLQDRIHQKFRILGLVSVVDAGVRDMVCNDCNQRPLSFCAILCFTESKQAGKQSWRRFDEIALFYWLVSGMVDVLCDFDGMVHRFCVLTTSEY